MKIKNLSLILIGGVILTVFLYACLLIYLTWPISNLSINSSGVFGDSFGLLTSLFSGLAFAGLIITIVMQRDELALQREELSLTRQELSGQKLEMEAQNRTLLIQQFENTFFRMLGLLEACRNDVSYQNEEGRDAIKGLYNLFTNHYLNDWIPDNFDRRKVFKNKCSTEDGVVEEYSKFYLRYGDELGQYYRTLYNILKLVDRAELIDKKSIYTNLVRAQLSRFELSLLFYNCLSDFGKEKMAPLVKKYHILKYLEETTLPNENMEIWQNFKA